MRTKKKSWKYSHEQHLLWILRMRWTHAKQQQKQTHRITGANHEFGLIQMIASICFFSFIFCKISNKADSFKLNLLFNVIVVAVAAFFFRVQRNTCISKKKMALKWSAYLSLWNFKLCTTCGLFCRKFHKCSVSSAVTVTSAPSLTKNTMWSTAQADSPSCRTWQSTPGFPNLFR